MTPTLKAGSLAYYETVRDGVVPCKVVKIIKDSYDTYAFYCVTATRGAYKRGQVWDTTIRHCFPRECLRTVRGSYGRKRYITPYKWEVTVNVDNEEAGFRAGMARESDMTISKENLNASNDG